jgi:tRNA-dihydrouridine synthase B
MFLPLSERFPQSSVRPHDHGVIAGMTSLGFSVGRFSSTGLALAPMAGATDAPFRELCREFGADYTIAEMVSLKAHLLCAKKSLFRREFAANESPKVAQLVGSDADELAEAARVSAASGVDVVDINMGCPAKKVAKRAAGAALLESPANVRRILTAVVNAVSVPVTLKFRTGIAPDRVNAVTIAKIAEDAGVALLTLHGRTRACGFSGQAEYETIAAVKAAVSIPVLANGDIDSAEKALAVLAATKANGVMVGRAAVGQPWLFREIAAAMRGDCSSPLSPDEKRETVLRHIKKMETFYQDDLARGARHMRKHLLAYAKHLALPKSAVLAAETLEEQAGLVSIHN